jgi:plasmid replication initiation protein
MEVSVMEIEQLLAKEKLIITQANALAKSVQEMTLQEKRLLLLAISHIRRSDDNFVLYRIPVRRIIEYLGLDNGSYYSRINKITTSLLGRVIEIEQNNGDWEKFQWVSYCRYRSKGTSDMPEACLDIRMHDCLRPLLLDLQKHFGSVYLYQIAPIPSFNSMRVFELLYYSAMYSKVTRQFKKPNISFKVLDFKKRLGMEGKYRNFKDFRKDILRRAQKDCEMYSPLVFAWREESKGRKIITLHFTIEPNPKFKHEQLPLLEQERQPVVPVTQPSPAPVPDVPVPDVPVPDGVCNPVRNVSGQPQGIAPTVPDGEVLYEIPVRNVSPVISAQDLVSTTGNSTEERVASESEPIELIFDYALSGFSQEEKKQAIVTISSIPEPGKQVVLDELNSAIEQDKARERWQYLNGLVRAYHRDEFNPTSDLSRRRKEEQIKKQAKRCSYCNNEGIIYLQIKDGAILPKPCSHNEEEIINDVISKGYNVINAKSSNNRLEQIKKEFQTTRHQKVIEIWDRWDNETRRTETVKFLNRANSYTRKLFNEHGLEHSATLARFTLYMVEQNYLPPEFNNLKDWYSCFDKPNHSTGIDETK